MLQRQFSTKKLCSLIQLVSPVVKQGRVLQCPCKLSSLQQINQYSLRVHQLAYCPCKMWGSSAYTRRGLVLPATCPEVYCLQGGISLLLSPFRQARVAIEWHTSRRNLPYVRGLSSAFSAIIHQSIVNYAQPLQENKENPSVDVWTLMIMPTQQQ